MSKIAYTLYEASDEIGQPRHIIVEAIRSGALVARYLPNGSQALIITHYDLELWLLGLEDYQKGEPARAAAEQAKRDKATANAEAKTKERREAKAARAAAKAAQAEEDARLAADLAELERLRAERQ